MNDELPPDFFRRFLSADFKDSASRDDFSNIFESMPFKEMRGYLDALREMMMELENKDRFISGHAQIVAKQSFQVAREMQLECNEAEIIEHAAFLHDVGKICISDKILLKPGSLSSSECDEVRQHAYLGYKMLKPLKFLDREAELVLCHHEWYNGQGYPTRLRGMSIPLGARIISVVESYDTMRHSGGRYKNTRPVEGAVHELIQCAGTQFDPKVVKSFMGVLVKHGELDAESYDAMRLEELIQVDIEMISKAASDSMPPEDSARKVA